MDLRTLKGQCPYCAERIALVVDDSDQEAPYIEDCPVCCRPFYVQIHHHQLFLHREDDGPIFGG